MQIGNEEHPTAHHHLCISKVMSASKANSLWFVLLAKRSAMDKSWKHETVVWGKSVRVQEFGDLLSGSDQAGLPSPGGREPLKRGPAGPLLRTLVPQYQLHNLYDL